MNSINVGQDVDSDVKDSASAPSPDDVRQASRSWLSQNWDPESPLLGWRRKLLNSGWAVPNWDRQWFGLGLPEWSAELVRDEIASCGAVGLPIGASTALAAPTILTHGADSVRRRFLEAILTGEHTWCQLFSEPGAGSDLAGVATRAERDGDRWIINGQKVWNTSAGHADYGLLVARTNWDVPKHQGLTYFAIPMNQPGVEIRPLRQMNFHSSFTEVFLADAVIPDDYVIGDVGHGWGVALTTLSYERRFSSLGRRSFKGGGRTIAEARAESDSYYRTYSWYPQRAGRVDLVIDHARKMDSASDPTVRQEVSRLLSMQRVAQLTAGRAAAGRALGRAPGAEGSIGKLAASNIARQANHVHTLIAGAHGMLGAMHSAYDGAIAEILISTPAQSIAGGTDEIQRNIIGERVLGLPREPSLDKRRAFSDVQRNV